MRHILFSTQQPSYDIAILIKETNFSKDDLEKHYVSVLNAQGISSDRIIAFDLEYPTKKLKVADAKEYLNRLVPALVQLGVKYIYCADAAYFKLLTKQAKADPHLGYVLPCAYIDYAQVVYGLNYAGLVYNPNQYPKLDLSINTFASVINGNFQSLGLNTIKTAHYPQTLTDIENFLESLHHKPNLVCDIETFSLDLHEAGIATIAFAWNKHEGGSFAVDYKEDPNTEDGISYFGKKVFNKEVRKLLKHFFQRYKGKIKYHNGSYDVKVLILNLFMQHPQDYQGMLHGLDIMFKNIDDTKVIAFLALNSTAEVSLGLKDLSHEYMGNYGQENINDVRLIKLTSLLEYNLKDCLATWYTYEKYYPIMLQDQQKGIYEEIMLPSLKIIAQMEIVGMPIDAKQVLRTEKELYGFQQSYLDSILNCPIVHQAEQRIQLEKLTQINAKLSTIQHGISKVQDIRLNPASPNQLRILLYGTMTLPVIDLTKTKEPATGADTIAKLKNHTKDPVALQLLNDLIDYSKVSKIMSAFIPAFKAATPKADGMSYLHANFNLNGTISGRMSCKNPNLQQIPSGSTYAKAVKQCFKPPKGWIFCSADFSSLEDRINALLTKDPNKLAVYTKGFDGHCLRAAYYFRSRLQHIDLDDPVSVNSIKDTHPDERQDSKAPTFALTYAGTWITLMKNCGFTEEEAKSIEKNYHEMYKISDQWLKTQLDLCCQQGYATVAFGLRVRTPLLQRSVLGNSKTLREAEAEARSVGNAISGQSYGLLNNRAAIAFMNKVWASKHRYSIFLVSMIHDAIYLIIKDDIEVVKWVNDNLPEEMSWQELPEIQHPDVKLSAEVDLHHPTWAQAITLPNNISEEQILEICKTKSEK